MKKIFVLDTNVLLRDGYALKKFQDNDIFLPITVIEELDKFKRGYSSTAQNARIASRIMDNLRQNGRLHDGVQIEQGLGKLYVQNGDLIDDAAHTNDDKILSFTKNLQKKYPNREVILVSKDLNMRIKADVLGIEAEDYQNDKINEDTSLFDDYYLESDNDTIVSVYQNGQVETDLELPDNSYWVLTIDEMPAIPVKYRNYIFYRIAEYPSYQGIKARNYEQAFLFDALMDPEIKVLFVIGTAGVGKTQLVLAAILEMLDKKKFKKIYISRPTIPLGGSKYNEYGTLPGDLKQKLDPWFGAIYDNLANLIEYNAEELIHQGFIELGAIGFLRGRTLKNTFMFIDETQGTTPMEIKTILSRVGENSKIVFAGDIFQIDNPLLSTYDNGLTYASSKLKGQPEVSVIYMKECQRSYVASLAEKL